MPVRYRHKLNMLKDLIAAISRNAGENHSIPCLVPSARAKGSGLIHHVLYHVCSVVLYSEFDPHYV